MSGVHRAGCQCLLARSFVGKIYSLIVFSNLFLPK
jgi:hypothetical protein